MSKTTAAIEAWVREAASNARYRERGRIWKLREYVLKGAEGGRLGLSYRGLLVADANLDTKEITLDHCGWQTDTTVRAMNTILSGLDTPYRVGLRNGLKVFGPAMSPLWAFPGITLGYRPAPEENIAGPCVCRFQVSDAGMLDLLRRRNVPPWDYVPECSRHQALFRAHQTERMLAGR